jgi:hypothetical protein
MIPRALPRIGWSSDLDTYSTPACQIATKQRRNGIASPAIFPKTGTARNNSIEKDNHFIRESTAHTSCLQSMQSRVGGACNNERNGGIRGWCTIKTPWSVILQPMGIVITQTVSQSPYVHFCLVNFFGWYRERLYSYFLRTQPLLLYR